MYIAPKNRILGVIICLLLVFVVSFYFSPAEPDKGQVTYRRDIRAASLAIRKVRKQLKSEIRSPEDPQARYHFEYMRLRDPKTGRIPENIRQKELAFSATIPVAEALTFGQTNRMARGQVLNWTSRGPYNVGGRTRALGIDVANENIINAGGVSGGMWRSTNGGQSWVKTTDPTLLQSVTTVAQDTRAGKTNTWYYGSGELVGNSASAPFAPYRGNGVFKSTNNGVSWTQLPATATSDVTTFNNVFQWVWRVATNPANMNQDEVFAATLGGIQRSVNGGQSWSNALGTINASEASAHARFTDIAISPSGVMYATLSQINTNVNGTATVRGIFRSTNGTDWTNITPSNWPQRYERIVLDISPSNENIVYFLANTPGAGKFNASLWRYTYVSGNGAGTGGTWEDRSANIPAFGGSVGNYNHQDNYNMLVRVKPNNSNHVFIGGTNLYRSTDGFATTTNTRWIGGYSLANTTALYPNHHPDQHELRFLPSNVNRSVSAHDGGLSRTDNIMATDTVRWTSLSRGYLTTQFTAVAIDPDATNDNFILGGMQDNGSFATESASPTAEWNSLLSGDGAFGAAVGNSLFVSAQNGFIIRYAFSNTGAFRGYARVDPKGGGGYLFVNPYVLDPNNQFVMYLPAGDTLWRNSNIDAIPVGQGNSFTQQQNTNWKVINVLPSNQSISAIAISKTPANILYLGTSNGQVYRFTNTLASDAPPRTLVTSPQFPANGYISSIAVDPNNANNVLVTFSNYNVMSVFSSTNGGTSWTPVGGNLEQNPDGTGNGPAVKWINILPGKNGMPHKYFVGTSTGLYATSNLNGGSTVWVKEGSTTIGSVPVDMVISRSTDNLVVVGTHGNGVYSHNYNEPLAVPDNKQPEHFEVKQNFPNPFSASTTIRYSLNKAGNVSVKVFDLNGREIVTLVNAQQNPGSYEAVWNGRAANGGRLANGLYLYQVRVGSQQVTKQMMLLK